MADINNRTGITSDNNINSSSDINMGSMSSTFSEKESFVNTPRFAGIEAETSTASAQGYQQYIDKGREYLNRGMESMRPLVSDIRSQVSAQVDSNPWIAVGAAAGLCFGIGYLIGRSVAPTRETSAYADYTPGMSNTVGSTTTPNVGVDINNGNTDRGASENLTMSPSY